MKTVIRSSRDMGHAIRSLRKQAGWTQVELAKRAGCSTKWISQAENGRRRSDLMLACRVLTVLGAQIVVRDTPPAPDDGLLDIPSPNEILDDLSGSE